MHTLLARYSQQGWQQNMCRLTTLLDSAAVAAVEHWHHPAVAAAAVAKQRGSSAENGEQAMALSATATCSCCGSREEIRQTLQEH